jgi:hypothetical protein
MKNDENFTKYLQYWQVNSVLYSVNEQSKANSTVHSNNTLTAKSSASSLNTEQLMLTSYI